MQVIFRRQKPEAFVLAVNLQKLRAQFPQRRRRRGAAADAAHGAAVRADFPLQEQRAVLLGHKPERIKFLQDRIGKARKARADVGALFPAAHEFPRRALAEHRMDGVDHNGFAGARLTGQDVEAGAEFDIRFFDDRNIFNIKLVEHVSSPHHFGKPGGELLGGLRAVRRRENRVVAGKRPDDGFPMCRVEGDADRLGHAGVGL